ncbi:MAG: FAD:protein FMN transferase [Pseudomonadales bacterium]|nr:FAD:protein FMN transferase [Pseudomonadales bacterium]
MPVDASTVKAAPEPLSFGSRQTTITPKNGYFVGEFFAMGCPCQVLMETDDVQLAEGLLAKVRDEAWRIEARWSRYLSSSLVQQINQAPDQVHVLDAETASLMDYCHQLWQLSEGAFDITSGVLRQVWTFDGGDSVPSQSKVEDILQYVGWHKASWQSPNLRLLPDMQIDLGGVGKEYAVDLCATRLCQHSDISCLVNFGGDCAVSRARKRAPGWDVGIESTAALGEAGTRVLLQEGALATSGNSHRFVWYNGERLSHILDARTGWPVPQAPRSVTVQANTCLEAGMFATLACLHGGSAQEFLEQGDVRYWLRA